MDVLTALVMDGVGFGRTAIGLVVKPYETYRRIVSHSRLGELIYISTLVCVYFAVASLVKVAAFRPFLLTKQFFVLSLAATGKFVMAAGSLWVAGTLLKTTFKTRALLVAWGYTLLPTIAWFFITSLLYVILPPPRTTSVLGMSFSVLFIMFSVTLLWWKIMMSYLTVRFVFKLDLLHIAVLCGIALPIIAGYSSLMYYWGIFKVPFL